MKILVCGDSWTSAWGVKSHEAWPSYLNYETTNVAHPGLCNEQITNSFLKNYDKSFDLVIIGWSGVTRFLRPPDDTLNKNTNLYEFSLVDENTINFFKNMSLNDILLSWQEKIDIVNQTSKVPVLHFSVFGDKPINTFSNFLFIGFLEFLSEKQNMKFKNDIPIFEFDWLNEENYKLVGKFGKKYFNKNWQRACIEREMVRPGKYFLPCGHPNTAGHALWGEYIKDIINDKFKQ